MLKKLAMAFCLLLLFLLWCSWELNDLMTPRVYCVAPSAGQMAGTDGEVQSYSCVLPASAVYSGRGDERIVYVVEETSSFFTPTVTRRLSVYALAESPGEIAITGLPADEKQIVLYSSHPLTGESESVKLWERDPTALHGWIEVTYDDHEDRLRHVADASAPILHQAGLDIKWADDRLMIENADLFTAERMKSILSQAGIAAESLTIRDYSWANTVLRQGNQLWKLSAAFAAVLLLLRISAALGCSIYQGFASGHHITCATPSHKQKRHLFTKLFLLSGAILLCAALLRWLWQVKLTLPTGFLPEKSIFNIAHYKHWWLTSFPDGLMSSTAKALSASFIRVYLLAAIESVAMLLAVAILPIEKFRKGLNDYGWKV